MNHLATPRGASSPAAAELAAVGPETSQPDFVISRPLALISVANHLVAVVLAPLNPGFDADKWWAQPPL